MSADEALQRLSPAENTAIGIAAGVIDVSSTQWILYCKNATQQKIPIKFQISVLYRGYTASLVNMSILSGLQVQPIRYYSCCL